MQASRSLRPSGMGDAAFDRLVRTHRAPLERYARGMGASREDAEELAATALLRAYQSPPEARLDHEWRAWLSTVVRNLVIDTSRRRRLRLVTGDGVLETAPSTDEPVDQIAAAAEEARQICAAIALLPATQRAAIYLREVRGLSYDEISAELGMTERAVTSTLHRARENVKQRRGGFARVLSGLSFSPLALLRRGTGAARSAGSFGAAVKAAALPVMLVTGVGASGAALVALHASAAAPHRTTATAGRSSPAGVATAHAPASRTALTPAVPGRPAPAAPPPRTAGTARAHRSPAPPAVAATAGAATTPTTSTTATTGSPAQQAAATTGGAGPPGFVAPARHRQPAQAPGPRTPPAQRSHGATAHAAARASTGTGRAASQPAKNAPANRAATSGAAAATPPANASAQQASATAAQPGVPANPGAATAARGTTGTPANDPAAQGVASAPAVSATQAGTPGTPPSSPPKAPH